MPVRSRKPDWPDANIARGLKPVFQAAAGTTPESQSIFLTALRRSAATMTGPTRSIVVRSLSGRSSRAYLEADTLRTKAALGRSGTSRRKREGDGATPAGCFSLLKVFYRADRIRRPETRLPTQALKPEDGWCDAPEDRNYNRFVKHPYPSSAERLWREDELYDVIVVLDANERPRIRFRGSAIFLHIARSTGSGLGPTEGCVALKREHLLRVLKLWRPNTRLQILR